MEIDPIEIAIEVAKNSTCLRSKCGSIIIKDNKIIGKGYNSPPNEIESQRRCLNNKENYDKKITDKTCCIHAEQRAIMDALKNSSDNLKESKLYFIRLDKNNNIEFAAKPYCTICSKMALDVGIKYFVLLHDNGLKEYPIEEYNDLSYEFKN